MVPTKIHSLDDHPDSPGLGANPLILTSLLQFLDEFRRLTWSFTPPWPRMSVPYLVNPSNRARSAAWSAAPDTPNTPLSVQVTPTNPR